MTISAEQLASFLEAVANGSNNVRNSPLMLKLGAVIVTAITSGGVTDEMLIRDMMGAMLHRNFRATTEAYTSGYTTIKQGASNANADRSFDDVDIHAGKPSGG